jgi:Toxin co-regulated pilus biosynthesis protein Q
MSRLRVGLWGILLLLSGCVSTPVASNNPPPDAPVAVSPEPEPAAAATAPVIAKPAFVLERSSTIQTSLKKWAENTGWVVVWHASHDFSVPAYTVIDAPDFVAAVSEVVHQLESQNIHIFATFYRGNLTVVVTDL